MRGIHPLSMIKTLSHKNRCIQNRMDYPAAKNRVNIEHWIPLESGVKNLGDSIATPIVEWLLAQKGMTLDAPVNGTKFLSTVGSILDNGVNDCTVWGSGLLREKPSQLVRPLTKKLDIRAVRGPRTAAVLRSRGYKCPEVYGDPAILLPLLYQPQPYDGPREPLFVSHMKDAELFRGNSFNMKTDDYKALVEKIARASVVVTTSLHGVIIAECYGVPSVLMSSNRGDFTLFKYRDWYESTGRPVFPIVHGIDEALDITPAPVPQLEDMRSRLMDVFPYDLWG